jgi:hypothetical protein
MNGEPDRTLSADANAQPLENPKPWLARAVQIYENTPPDLRKRISDFVYQPFDQQN